MAKKLKASDQEPEEIRFPENHFGGCDCEDCRRVIKIRAAVAVAKNHNAGCECEHCSKLRKWGHSHGGKTVETKESR